MRMCAVSIVKAIKKKHKKNKQTFAYDKLFIYVYEGLFRVNDNRHDW